VRDIFKQGIHPIHNVNDINPAILRKEATPVLQIPDEAALA
jgi:hypothetical protein